jgi:hypothetical protein
LTCLITFAGLKSKPNREFLYYRANGSCNDVDGLVNHPSVESIEFIEFSSGCVSSIEIGVLNLCLSSKRTRRSREIYVCSSTFAQWLRR